LICYGVRFAGHPDLPAFCTRVRGPSLAKDSQGRAPAALAPVAAACRKADGRARPHPDCPPRGDRVGRRRQSSRGDDCHGIHAAQHGPSQPAITACDGSSKSMAKRFRSFDVQIRVSAPMLREGSRETRPGRSLPTPIASNYVLPMLCKWATPWQVRSCSHIDGSFPSARSSIRVIVGEISRNHDPSDLLAASAMEWPPHVFST